MNSINIPVITYEKSIRRRFTIPANIKLFLMVLPFMVLTFLFSYLPIYGWVYALFDFKPGLKLSECKYMGLYFFKILFSDPITSAETIRVLRNTFAISFLNLLTTPIPVIFAIFLTEIRNKRLKKVIQTLTTIPNFLSWILVYSFAFAMFSVDDGFINRLLMSLNPNYTPVNFLASSDHVWLTQTAYGLWKGMGWSAIIYLSAIAFIDSEQYEAAIIDGAGRFRMMWHITVPGILSTFFVILLLTVANLVNNGVGQYYVFMNAMNKDYIEVLDLYVYNVGIRNGMMGFNYSFATAIGVLKSVVSVVLLFTINYISNKVRHEKII